MNESIGPAKAGPDERVPPAGAGPRDGRRNPPFFASAMRVFELSLGEMLWSRRTIFMALVVGGPVVLAVVARLLQESGVPALRVNGVRVGGTGIFGMMIWVLFVRFIVPVLGVFYGTALVADEVEDKTITYLFTRPIQRGAVLVGKYLAYLVCTTLVVLPSVMLVYFMMVPFSEVPASFPCMGRCSPLPARSSSGRS
jgi:ABC-type multidrug transport system permease subunit